MRNNVLVTGGAGFIGSNIVKALITDKRVNIVRVVDDLSTGFYKNLKEFESHPNFQFIKGDIREYKVCLQACGGMNLISHQAAIGSVPRSIKDPLTTDSVNIGGTLNIFKAAVDNKVKRVVFAASSSTYGDEKKLPKVEDKIGAPLSPYAVTKLVNELYASVFAKNYDDFEYIGLRYFNVFGPKQDPNGAYAAVIPLFFKAAIENLSPKINGDGTFSRDFTYVQNAVNANLLALFCDNNLATNHIYNVACGQKTNLTELWETIKNITNCKVDAEYGPVRQGDIPHSVADISKIKNKLKYEVEVNVKEGLNQALNYYKNIFKNG